MANLNAIIVEDEENARNLLKEMVKGLNLGVKVVAEVPSVKQAVSAIEFHKPDIVFLDVELSDGNGFDVLNALEKQYFHVIFITGYDHYAIKAFRYSSVDYLLKPLHLDQLEQALEKVKDLRKPDFEKLSYFHKQVVNPEVTPRQIVISHSHGYSFIQMDDILRIEASGSYVYFHLTGGQKILANYNLGYYEEFLPEYKFFRAHKSFIVNLSHVRHYEAARGGFLILSDGSKVEVAQRRKPVLMEYLKSYNA